MDKTGTEIIAEIKLEFLLLIRDYKPGYFISLEKTYTWLENIDVYNSYVTDVNARRNFRKRYLRSEKLMLDESTDENDINKDYIMRKNDNNINMPWFSTEGFKTFCMVINETKSNYIRKYFIQIEKDYLRVLKQSSEITALELATLNIDLDKARLSIIKISDASEAHLIKKLELEYKLKSIENIETIINDYSDFATNGNNEYKEYVYLREMHMKKIPLYIVKPEAVINKSDKSLLKVSDSGNDSDLDFTAMINIKPLKKNAKLKAIKPMVKDVLYYTKNYNEYTFKDIYVDDMSTHDSPTLYYYLGGFMEKVEKNIETHYKICDILVFNKEHLNDIKMTLNSLDAVNSSKKWIYKTTYTHIKNIALGISSNKLCDLLLVNKNISFNN